MVLQQLPGKFAIATFLRQTFLTAVGGGRTSNAVHTDVTTPGTLETFQLWFDPEVRVTTPENPEGVFSLRNPDRFGQVSDCGRRRWPYLRRAAYRRDHAAGVGNLRTDPAGAAPLELPTALRLRRRRPGTTRSPLIKGTI